MSYKIEKIDDTDEAKRMHKLAFGGIAWPGDDHEFWIARGRGKDIFGFASAELVESGVVFLSRAAVVQKVRGLGIHRDLIQQRMLWAANQGAGIVVTYTENHNYPALMNLINAGFKFAPNGWRRGYRDYHLMYYPFKPQSEAMIKLALQDIGE